MCRLARSSSVASALPTDIAFVVTKLDNQVRGWGHYFRGGNPARKLAQIDRYVHERLAMFMSAKHQLPRRRNWRHYNREWLQRMGVYQLTGQSAVSRRMPCDERCRRAVCGEPHVRFEKLCG
jgi:Group II intron, maturase-specific domain